MSFDRVNRQEPRPPSSIILPLLSALKTTPCPLFCRSLGAAGVIMVQGCEGSKMAESYKPPPKKGDRVHYMTVDEYLRYEQSSEQKHEYVSGYVFAMTGARQAHEIVCGNLFSLVRTHLRGSGCRAFQSNMKVKIATADIFYYPDLVVTCEPYEPESVMVQKPCLIGEVHSPSTKHIDRREKLVAYTQIESLREYLMVSPNKYRIELVRKNADGEWESTVYGKD